MVTPDQEQVNAESDSGRASPWHTLALGGALIIAAATLAYTFLRFWPDAPDGQSTRSFEAIGIVFSAEIRMLLLVMCAGGLGSFLHAATSFADYVGNQRLSTSWFWWYGLRLPIGMVLALVIYAVIRGGMLVPGAGPENLSRYGVVAVAFLSGMFSKQATDKLDELFKTLFRTEPSGGDAQRSDKLTDVSPTITGIAPSPAPAGVTTLTIDGTEFSSATQLSINGQLLDTTLVSSTRLTVDLPAGLSVAGTLTVKAITDDRESAPVTLQIVA